MDELLLKFHKHNTPVFLSNITSNQKNQPPFISIQNKNSDTATFMLNYKAGIENYNNKNYPLALNLFLKANSIDSTYALNNYYLANIYYETKNYTTAKKYYINAKEYDALRFRAPEQINTIIYSLSKKYNNIHFVNVQQKFEQNATNGIMDSLLFTEHLHPTLLGYYLVSDVFYNDIVKSELIKSDSTSFNYIADIRNKLPITAIDSVYGKLEVLQLKTRWPFSNYVDVNKLRTHTFIEDLVIDIFVKKTNAPAAMFKLYSYYLNQKKYNDALIVLKSIELEIPNDYNFCKEIAILCFNLNEYNEAIFYYRKAFKTNYENETIEKMFLCLLKTNKIEESIKYLNILTKNDTTDNRLVRLKRVLTLKNNLKENANNINSLNELASFYIQLENYDIAQTYLNKALLVDSKNVNSNKMMKILQNSQNKLLNTPIIK